MTHNEKAIEADVGRDPGQQAFDEWVESREIDLENATGLLVLATASIDGSYPSCGFSTHRCQLVDVVDEGPIAAGTRARLEAIPEQFVEATNRGKLIPPSGTPLLLLRDGQHWTFTWGQ